MYPDLRMKGSVYDKKFNVQAEREEDATEETKNVHEELKKHTNKRSCKLSLDEGGTKDRVKCCARANGRWETSKICVFLRTGLDV